MFKRLQQPYPYNNTTRHQCTSEAYIATLTAFWVVNITFLPGLIVWTAPAIIGLAVINITVSRYRRKFKLNTTMPQVV